VNALNDKKNIDQFDFDKLKRILARRKWIIIFCVVAMLTLVTIYNETQTPMYRAQTTIIFEEQQSPTALFNPFRNALTSSFITNQIEELKSWSLAEEVVAALPPGILNTFPLPKNRDKTFNRNDYIAYQIQQGISASTVPNSEIIKISAQAYSSIAAKVIANTIADVFQKRNLEVKKEETSNVRQIIEDQLETFKNQLDSAEYALKQFKEQSRITVIDKEAEEIYKRITEAEIIYNQTIANLGAARKRLDFIQQKLKQERQDLVPAITQITSPWARKLKQQLVDLQEQLTKLQLQKYPETHPKIVELKDQIEQTKNNLKSESLKIASGENLVDPISQIQKYMEESISLEIELQTYKAQETTLKNVIDSYKKNLNTLPYKELQLAQLLRDKEVNEKIYTMLLHKKEEARIAEAEKLGNIRIIDPARFPQKPFRPQKKLLLFLGTVFGLVLGIGLAFFLEAIDDTIKSVEDAEMVTNLKVLGVIPIIKKSSFGSGMKSLKKQNTHNAYEIISRLTTLYKPESYEAESFRTLRLNLQLVNPDRQHKTMLITSVNPNEGKSFIAVNLSIVAAQLGLKTLIVDADIQKPALDKIFKVEAAKGLLDLANAVKQEMYKSVTESLIRKNGHSLMNQDSKSGDPNSVSSIELNTTDDIFRNHLEHIKSQFKQYIQPTKIKNLEIITCGKRHLYSSESVASNILKNIFVELENQYDIIFIDSPPIEVTTIARTISAISDGTFLVIKSNKSTKKEILRAQKTLEYVDSNLLGLVINHMDTKDDYTRFLSYYSQTTTINTDTHSNN